MCNLGVCDIRNSLHAEYYRLTKHIQLPSSIGIKLWLSDKLQGNQASKLRTCLSLSIENCFQQYLLLLR